MKILLCSAFSQFSGYGKDGIGLARALLERGHDVRISPAHIDVPLPRDIAGLLTYDLTPPFDLAIHHMPPNEAELLSSEKEVARRSILWTMWEWESIDYQDWAYNFRSRTELFDYVVAYDSGTANAFANLVEVDRLKVVQGGFEADEWKVSHSFRPNRPFIFGMNGRLNARKGVYTAYKAYQLLQERHGSDFNARLVLKSIVPVFPPNFPTALGVQVIVSQDPIAVLQDFYHQINCLLAPSWGEGKNLPALEALASGTPVILSDIPAHRQWATSNEVTWAKTETKALTTGLVGGYVSPEVLAEAMWYQYTNAAEEAVKARSAASMVSSAMDWSKAVERLSLVCGLYL